MLAELGIGVADVMKMGPVGAVVLAVLTGLLIPRWTHKERMNDKDAQIRYLQAALDKRDEQVGRLLDQGETSVHLLEDIKATAERRQLGGGRR